MDTRLDLSRATAHGTQLIEIHDWLRDQLDLLVEQVDDYASANGPLPQPLQVHCLAFCSALDRHHTGEDREVFPALAAANPGLAPVIARLQQDHRMLEGMILRLTALVRDLAAPGFSVTPHDPDGTPGEDEQRRRRTISGEVGQVAALMESHFAYEERQITTALNQLH